VARVVLTTKVEPTYDDLPEIRYHFPRTYLRRVEQAVSDHCVYYELRCSTGEVSSRGRRSAYGCSWPPRFSDWRQCDRDRDNSSEWRLCR
jgi:hypothetical protein